MQYTVSSGSGLISALKAAQSGDQILMAGGDYGSVKISGIKIDGEVTITSADPNAPAVIQYLSVGDSKGLTFDGLEINVRPGSLGIGVGNSSDIRFENMNIHGTVDGEYTLDGDGMTVKYSSNVTIANSTFHDLSSGFTHIEVNGLVLSGNSLHDIRSDGIHGTRSTDVTIADNTFTNFHPYGADHPDAIQFWTNGDVPTSNITITGNTIIRGDGGKTQGIFLGDESGAGYKDVTITGNAVIGGMYHGIRLVHGDGAVISNNLVIGYSDMTSWIMIKDSTNFVAQNNQATSFIISDYDLLGNGNQFLQQAAIGDLSGLASWQADPGKLAQIDDGSLSSGSNLADKVVDPVVDTGTADGTDTAHQAPVESGMPGADTLVGTAGADTLSGGAGDDKYMVNHVGDVVIETNGGGADTVFSTLSDYSLPVRDANGMIENLVLVGSGPQSATGNQLANLIVGSAYDNTLNGGQGDDTLVAGGGHDVINGGPGRDLIVLDGDPNSFAEIHTFAVNYDTLDLSNLLQAYSGKDPVADGWVKFVVQKGGANAGTQVFVDVDGPGGPSGFVQVANMVLQKTTMVMGTDWTFGNQFLHQAVIGAPIETGPTPGADSLAGTAGADTLAGGAGDDKYMVNHVGDVVIETNGGGTDTVFSTLSDYALPLRDAKGMIENLVLVGSGPQSATGNQLNNLIVGSTYDNTLNGGAGDDTLVAGGGHDVINGGAGRDLIVLDGDPNSFAEIHTFAVNYDTLDLSNLLQGYSGTDPVADGWVQFVVHKGGANAGTQVFVDVDGPGGPSGFVEVANMVLQKTTMVMGTDWIF